MRINKARQVYSNTIKSRSCPLEQHNSQCEAIELDLQCRYSNSSLSRASFTNNLHDNQQRTSEEKSMWSDHSLKKQAATQHPISERHLSSICGSIWSNSPVTFSCSGCQTESNPETWHHVHCNPIRPLSINQIHPTGLSPSSSSQLLWCRMAAAPCTETSF